MRKLVALAVVVILSSNVMASEGGINEETDLSNTDLESMQYSNIVYAEEEFSISMSLKNETTNISQINWITQVAAQFAHKEGTCGSLGSLADRRGFHAVQGDAGEHAQHHHGEPHRHRRLVWHCCRKI